VAIEEHIDDNCKAVKADPTQIHQIVMNLATNASHAMEENGGIIKVSLKEIKFGENDLISPDMKPGIYICLSIADGGRGMDEELIKQIFNPFFTTKEKGRGTGMGLATVHGIVKKMNGEIQVLSEPGKGAIFNIYFPAEKS
jgi:signal transduction histidine kinase